MSMIDANTFSTNDPYRANRENLSRVSNKNEEYLAKLKKIREKTSDPEEIRALMNPDSNQNSKKSLIRSEEQKDMFLKILMAQLKNQGLDPPKTEKFVQQLSAFVTNEQLIEVNSKLEKQMDSIRKQEFYAATNLIGTEVDFQTSDIELNKSAALFSYDVPDDEMLKEVKVMITNASGLPIRETKGPAETGRHQLAWDGKNTQDLQQEDGLYKIIVTGVKANGEMMPLKTYNREIITGIHPKNNKTYLRAGSREFLLDKVDSFNIPRSQIQQPANVSADVSAEISNQLKGFFENLAELKAEESIAPQVIEALPIEAIANPIEAN